MAITLRRFAGLRKMLAVLERAGRARPAAILACERNFLARSNKTDVRAVG
jgi:hypothetical protein